MHAYLIVNGRETILRSLLEGLRAAPPAGWEAEAAAGESLRVSGRTNDLFLILRSPVVGDRRFELSLIITLGRLLLNTIIPVEFRAERPMQVREQLKIVHRFYTQCLKEFLSEHPDVTIEKLNVQGEPESPELR
ncbi:MAG: hypothetical protein RIF32_14415 [Leptospirales bacterium]